MQPPPIPPNGDNSRLSSTDITNTVSQSGFLKKIIFWILDRILLVIVALVIMLGVGFSFLYFLQSNKLDKKFEHVVESATKTVSTGLAPKIEVPLINDPTQNVGRNSLKFYRSYLEEQATCQAKAASIRGCVEPLLPQFQQTGLYGYTDPRLAGLQKALRICAGYYNRSSKFRATLSDQGVDSSVLSFVNTINELDQQTANAYMVYADQPTSSPNKLINLNSQRQKFYLENEQVLISNFESKYGIKLPTRNEIYEQVKKDNLDSVQVFINAQEPRKLSEYMVGSVLTDKMSGAAWTVRQGEYISGKIIKSIPVLGGCIIEVEMAFSSVNDGNSSKTHAFMVAAEDPDLNIFWFYFIGDAK
jgi:hypothetical protein